MDKQEIRKRGLEKRNELNPAQVSLKSRIIVDKIQKLKAFKEAQNSLFYYPYKKEVNLSTLFEMSSKEIYLPKIKNGEHFIPTLFSGMSNMAAGEFGIKESKSLKLIDKKKIEIIFVPGVVFDRKGNRIGMGKGYYDRFLKRTPQALKIGIAFEEQLLDQVPKDQYDIAVDLLITDKDIYYF